VHSWHVVQAYKRQLVSPALQRIGFTDVGNHLTRYGSSKNTNSYNTDNNTDNDDDDDDDHDDGGDDGLN